VVPLWGVTSQAHKKGSWYPLGFFKVSGQHSRPPGAAGHERVMVKNNKMFFGLYTLPFSSKGSNSLS